MEKHTLIKLENGFTESSKEDLVLTAQETAKDLIQSGYSELGSEYVKARKMIFFLQQFCDSIQSDVSMELSNYPSNKATIHKAELIDKAASKRLNYNEDHLVSELDEKLKERKKIVKLATESKDDIFDSSGVKVEPVSHTYSGGGISCTIK